MSFWRLRALETLSWVGGSWPAQGGCAAALGAASIPLLFIFFPLYLIEYLYNYFDGIFT